MHIEIYIAKIQWETNVVGSVAIDPSWFAYELASMIKVKHLSLSLSLFNVMLCNFLKSKTTLMLKHMAKVFMSKMDDH